MRQTHRPVPRTLPVVALVLGVAACTHPAKNRGGGNGGGNGGTSDSNSGGTGGARTGGNNPGGASGGGSGGSSGDGEQVVGGSGGGGSGPAAKTDCKDPSSGDAYSPGYIADPAITAKVKSLLGTMSLADKANQMRGTDPGSGGGQYNDIFRTMDNAAKGIRGFLFRDGPRGVNLDAPTPSGAAHGKATVFPVPIARGAAWDLDLEYRIGEAIGDEMVAAGQTLMLAPTVNILRNPLWGRAQETYGEDPYQLGRFGSALVVGVQQYVPACAKHYAANNIEQGRASLNAMMDEQTLREMYARHFGMIVKEAGVACVMAAYNAVNGTKSTQNKHLLTDILRGDFGFRGFVLTDWWAMPGGQSPALATDTRKANAAQAVQAGLDMELPWALNFSVLESITGTGLPLQPAAIDEAAGRILEQKLRFKVDATGKPVGLKAATSSYQNGSIANNDAHITLALEAARKSMVLLKNDKNTLPIKRDAVKSIAVLGARVSYSISNSADDPNGGMIDFATAVRTGDVGSSRVNADLSKSVGPLAGVQKAAGSGITVTSGNAAAMAQGADFIVVVAGLTPQDEGEEYTGAGDRASFALDAKASNKQQDALITQAAALGKPMVVVLEGGSVIDMPWLDKVPAVVMAWYPGMVGGQALGELIFGDSNPSGKLPITWAAASAYGTFNAGATTQMDYDLGYRRFDRMKTTPQFPFGYGLSYTKFEYSNLQVPCSSVTKDGVVNVTVDIQNTGTVAGDETAFLFVAYPGSTQRRPIKELKQFRRVSLEPGIKKRVTLPVRVSDLAFFDSKSSSWIVESGMVEVQVGPDAATLPLKDTFVVQ